MNELTYKILLGIIITGMNIIRAYYRKRYKQTHSVAIKEKNKPREKVLVGLMTLSIAVPGLMWLFTDWLAFGQFHLPDSARLLGFVVGMCRWNV